MLEDIYDDFANGAVNLSAEKKPIYRELKAKLSNLSLTYEQNVLKATNAWTKLLTEESLLVGVSEDVKKMLASNAEKKGLKGWLLDLKPTTYIPVMQYCENRDIRRELYMDA